MKNRRVGGRRRPQHATSLDHEERPDIWQQLTRALVGVLLLGVLVFVAAQFLPEVDKQRTVDAELAALTARRDVLVKERDSRRAKFERLRTNRDYFEVFARDKLDLRREGETIYRIERPEDGADAVPRAIEVEVP